MITVVCLNVGNAFAPKYVERLYSGIKRNTNKYFDFLCICDGKNSGRIRDAMPYGTLNTHIISEAEYPKWWGKMILFQPEFQDWVDSDLLFFDLDTIITGPVDDLLTVGERCPTNIAILKNFLQPPYRSERAIPCEYGSAVMWIKRGKMQEIYQTYKIVGGVQEKYDLAGGDQKFIEDVANPRDVTFLQDLFLDKKDFFRSVKYPTQLTQSPVGNSIICYHGRPRPHEDPNNPIIWNNWI